MISIVVPYFKRKDSDWQLERCLQSIRSQTYQDYEIVVMEKGSAPHNINEGVKQSLGSIVKLIGMDDYFTTKHALKSIVDAHRGIWSINGVSNNIKPYYTGDVRKGNNKLGGISSITCRKDNWIPMQEDLKWLFDCVWHDDMYKKYGEPIIIEGDLITIETSGDQATNTLQEKDKHSELLKI